MEKYVGTIYEGIIVAKGINYTGFIAENEIELDENQYNTIPIPCKLVDGEFVPCDAPQIEVSKTPPVSIAQISTGSYVGNGDKYKGITLNFDFVPRVIFITVKDKSITPAYATLINPLKFGHSKEISPSSSSDAVSYEYAFWVTWNEKSVHFYSDLDQDSVAPRHAMNVDNKTYEYIAIG